jgi:hypothetical protein
MANRYFDSMDDVMLQAVLYSSNENVIT